MRRTPWPTRGFESSGKCWPVLASLLLMACPPARAQKIEVPTEPPGDSGGISFRDSRYGVRFQVPPGWTVHRKDREVSTFKLDARTAPQASEMRAVASLAFNPFPRSVLSGALVYFSVARHSNDQACAAEASGHRASEAVQPESIGGMGFLHGHDEHGYMCVEARDEVYTAYRKGSCYRFDLTLNTFCSISSGAAELSQDQMRTLEAQMAGILSTVSLDWEKAGPQPVPVPGTPPGSAPAPPPRHPMPAARPANRPAAGVGV